MEPRCNEVPRDWENVFVTMGISLYRDSLCRGSVSFILLQLLPAERISFVIPGTSLKSSTVI